MFIPVQIELATLSRDGDSNPRPAVYKTAALPLSYLGKARLACQADFTGPRTSKPNFIKFGKIVLGQNRRSAIELGRRVELILSKRRK